MTLKDEFFTWPALRLAVSFKSTLWAVTDRSLVPNLAEVLVDLTDAPPPEKKIWPEKKEEAPPPVKKPKAKGKGKEKDRKMVVSGKIF